MQWLGKLNTRTLSHQGYQIGITAKVLDIPLYPAESHNLIFQAHISTNNSILGVQESYFGNNNVNEIGCGCFNLRDALVNLKKNYQKTKLDN